MAANALPLAAALATAYAAMSAADAPDKTTEHILEEMATATQNAAEHGTVPGTRAAIDRMKRKWCRFVTQFGVRLGHVSGASPSLQFVRSFAAYMHNNRDRWSAVERKGLGYSAFISAAYHLPRYVFPELGYTKDGLVFRRELLAENFFKELEGPAEGFASSPLNVHVATRTCANARTRGLL